MTTIDRNEINDLKRIDIRIFLPRLGWSPDPADRYKKATFTQGSRTVKTWQNSAGEYRATDHGDGLTGEAKKNFTKITYSVIDLTFEIVGDGQWKPACDLLRNIIGKTSDQSPKSPTRPDEPAHATQPSPLDQPPTKIKKTSSDVKAEYEGGSTVWRHGEPVPGYLVTRGITSLSKAFDSSFRTSESGTLRFAHRSFVDGRDSIGGVELRSDTRKGFYTEGGTNGIWRSCQWPESGILVVCESQIDAMSFDIMHPGSQSKMFLSLRAGAEHICVDYLRLFIDMGKISKVIVATDNDHAGITYAGKVLSGLITDRKEDEKYYGNVRAFYVAPPDGHEDWNDALRAIIPEHDDPNPTF